MCTGCGKLCGERGAWLFYCVCLQDTRVSELKRQLEGAESEGVKVSKEVEKLQEELRAAQEKDGVWQEKEGVWQVRCQQLEDKVKVLSNEKDSLHSTHLSEVREEGHIQMWVWSLGVWFP